jgi:tetratricopeptide (TPR) repeat protein
MRSWSACGLLVASVWALYGQTLWFDFQLMDDPGYVLDNPEVLRGLTWSGLAWAFTTIRVSTWVPLTLISFTLDAELWGDRPGGYHATNVWLHAGNCVLVYVWLRELTGLSGRSLAAAVCFAVHPLHVESVAWVSERKDVLSTLCGLLALVTYTRYARSGSRWWYAGCGLALVASLLAKPMLVTFPGILWLLDYWPLDRWSRQTARMLVLEKLPLVILCVLFAGMGLFAQSTGGALQANETFPMSVRLANVCLAYGVYLGKTLIPVGLAAYYPHPGLEVSFTHAGLAAVVLIFVSAVCVWRWRAQPWMFVSWCWFLGTLLPVIGLLQLGEQQLADRYTYVPHLGLFAGVIWMAAEWACRAGLPAVARNVAVCVTVGLLSVLCFLQVGLWRDTQTLMTHTLAVAGAAPVSHHNLALALIRAGDPEAAEKHLRQALALDPRYWRSHHSLGNVLIRRERWAEAAEHYRKALQDNPNLPTAQNNLGIIALHDGRAAEAVQRFTRALELDPATPRAAENLRLARGLLADTAEASEHGGPARAAPMSDRLLAPDSPASAEQSSPSGPDR